MIAVVKNKRQTCKRCGNEFLTYRNDGKGPRYCSKECRSKMVQVPCYACGTMLSRSPSRLVRNGNQQRQYCNAECQKIKPSRPKKCNKLPEEVKAHRRLMRRLKTISKPRKPSPWSQRCMKEKMRVLCRCSQFRETTEAKVKQTKAASSRLFPRDFIKLAEPPKQKTKDQLWKYKLNNICSNHRKRMKRKQEQLAGQKSLGANRSPLMTLKK